MAVAINRKTLSAAKIPVGNRLNQSLALLLLSSCREALITRLVFFNERCNLGFLVGTRAGNRRIKVLGFGRGEVKDNANVGVVRLVQFMSVC